MGPLMGFPLFDHISLLLGSFGSVFSGLFHFLLSVLLVVLDLSLYLAISFFTLVVLDSHVLLVVFIIFFIFLLGLVPKLARSGFEAGRQLSKALFSSLEHLFYHLSYFLSMWSVLERILGYF
jgi:hypothetical protein